MHREKRRIRQDSNRITIIQKVGVQTRLTCSSTKQIIDEHLLFHFSAHLLILSCKMTATLQVSDGFFIIAQVTKCTGFAKCSVMH